MVFRTFLCFKHLKTVNKGRFKTAKLYKQTNNLKDYDFDKTKSTYYDKEKRYNSRNEYQNKKFFLQKAYKMTWLLN